MTKQTERRTIHYARGPAWVNADNSPADVDQQLVVDALASYWEEVFLTSHLEGNKWFVSAFIDTPAFRAEVMEPLETYLFDWFIEGELRYHDLSYDIENRWKLECFRTSLVKVLALIDLILNDATREERINALRRIRNGDGEAQP